MEKDLFYQRLLHQSCKLELGYAYSTSTVMIQFPCVHCNILEKYSLNKHNRFVDGHALVNK